MPDVHFEIIRLEDIGKDIVKPPSTPKPANRINHKLSDVDVENLKIYINKYNQSPSKFSINKNNHQKFHSIDSTQSVDENSNHHNNHHQSDYVDVTEQFYTKFSQAKQQHSQPLIDIYRYHHHYRHHHHHTKHDHENIAPSSMLPGDHSIYSLETAICGMKKNTKLPVPRENFSLKYGCFGDDSGFSMRHDKKNFLGISDGAGGNIMYGFDPRLFSESLMRNCSDLAYTGKYSTNDPKRLLCHAFDRVQTENCFGSATACIIGIDSHTGQLHSVNIGDSGYVVVRNGHVVYRSRSQKMNGDCPRQLDVYPWTAALKRKGLNYTQISSLDAICQNFQLEPDDIVILSTDGLFDNVPYWLIEKIIAKHHSLKHAANELVNHAVRFYVKPDDILIIMTRITNRSHETNLPT